MRAVYFRSFWAISIFCTQIYNIILNVYIWFFSKSSMRDREFWQKILDFERFWANWILSNLQYNIKHVCSILFQYHPWLHESIGVVIEIVDLVLSFVEQFFYFSLRFTLYYLAFFFDFSQNHPLKFIHESREIFDRNFRFWGFF